MSPNIVWAKKALDLSNLSPEVKKELIQRFPNVEKEKLSLDQVDNVIRFLQQRPQYMRVFVLEDSSPYYKLEFDLTRTIGDIKIEGARNMSRFEMDSFFSVRSGDSFDQQDLIENGERLRQAYREKGYLNAVIDIEMPPGQEPGFVDIVLKVTENKQTLIHDIVIQSPNAELNKALRKEVKGFVRDPYTDKEMSDLLQRLKQYLNEKRYVRADVLGPTLEFNNDESAVQLTYRIDKVDRYIFNFEGATLMKRSKIEDALDLDNYTAGSPQVGSELAQKIKALYLSDGYSRAEIEHEELTTGKQFEREIRFKINEGPRVKIDKINISGRFSKKESYYIDFIKEHSSTTVSKGFFNKDDLETGVRNLTLELQNNGYLQAKVLSTRTQFNKAKDAVTFYLNLDEGPLTQIESITFEGNNAFPTEELLKVTRLSVGALRLNQIETAVSALKDFYKERGYIEMMLLNEREDLVQYDDSNTQAKLVFKIFEGPQVRVASIILDGNSFTRDRVILKELEFSEGDLVTPAKIDESIARLQRTGFFSSVEVKTLEEKTNVSNRTIIVKVSERDPGLFTLGAGATNERTLTLRGYAGVAYRNLWGTGRGVSLRLEGNYNIADLKYPEHRIVLGYLEPYIFNSRVRGRINITRAQTITDYDLAQVTEVNSTTYSLEQDFTSHILGVWDVWSLATYKDFGANDSYPYPTTEQNIATTGPTVDFDFRDNPFNPTAGNFTRLNAEYSAPFLGSTETIEYWRATASFTHYQHVTDWLKQPVVWANQLRGGYLQNLSKEPNGGVPWDKKGFTLGGRSTVRGYEAGTQEVFPNRDDLGTDKYILTTESTMFLIKSEVRFPVYGSLGGALFYDGGSVLIQGLDLTDPYRDSTGFAVRYNTPVGPLSLEFAWKLDRKEGEEPWRFHLAIGTF
ncbi:outer membrane protein assembly factor BamA [Bdellovibrio sp. HCB2-146]|uniref:outer membrane protein assembly factor BamA n=1 Tax=Bdellovibrio sp. HCB2-146 TaxID=3394362 RepID=UPI0039BC756C